LNQLRNLRATAATPNLSFDWIATRLLPNLAVIMASEQRKMAIANGFDAAAIP
jgi:hypothetical protein